MRESGEKFLVCNLKFKKMKKQFLFIKKSVIIALLWAIASFTAMAQPGIYPYSAGAGSCIPTSGNFTYNITLPEDTHISDFENIQWSVSGGIEIDSQTSTSITIKSKTSDNQQLGFPKYAKGRIRFSCTAKPIEDTACVRCTRLCNPYYSYTYDVYKLFPLNDTLNPIVGPVCVLQGDTVTYSVTPWVSIDKADIGIDNYKWELPENLADSILYYSADSSSITFVVNQLTGADIIKAQIGRCNFGDPEKYT